MVLEPGRRIGQFARKFQQQLQPLGFVEGLEIVNNVRQRGGQLQKYSSLPAYARPAGTEPRSVPLTIGTRTALPHSVQDPS